MDYDVTDNEYIVKWKGYPTAAICKTEVAASFLDLVTTFWANPENQPVPELAQHGIDALNDDNDDDDGDEKMTESVPSRASNGAPNGNEIETECLTNLESASSQNSVDRMTDEMDSKMSSLDIQCGNERDLKSTLKSGLKSNETKINNKNGGALGEGIFVAMKLEEVMDRQYIIRRQKYTKTTYQRMKSTQSKYRKWLQREIKNQTPLGIELKHFMKHQGLDRVPKYHLRSVNKDWDCDLPRIRDLILDFLVKDWESWNHDLSHPSVCRDAQRRTVVMFLPFSFLV